MTVMVLALLAQSGLQVGDRVEALPFGTRWESCVIVSESARDGGVGVRCEGGAEYFVAYKNVRRAAAPTRPPAAAQPAASNAPAAMNLAPGQRVEALPYGTQWQACQVTAVNPAEQMVGVRCDYGVDMSVHTSKVRAPTGIAAKTRYPGQDQPAPAAQPAAGALPIGKLLKCYSLAGTQLNYSYVDITFTSGSAYRDRRGVTGSYVRYGSEIRFTSGPFAQHRAQTKPGGVALFAPGASFGMTCN